MKVIPGPASKELGLKVAEKLGVEAVKMEYKLFPDGESYVRFDGSVEGETVAVVQSTYPPQDKHLMELCLIADTAKDLGAEKVIAVVPYLAYARQDKRFLPGEAISIRTVGRLLKAAGVDKLITVDAHSDEALRALGMEVVNVSAIDTLARYMADEKGLRGAFALAPDSIGTCSGSLWPRRHGTETRSVKPALDSCERRTEIGVVVNLNLKI